MKRVYAAVCIWSRMMRPTLLHLAGVTMFLMIAMLSSAQEGKQVSGRVTDDSGQAISGVSVAVKHRSQVEVATDDEGQFSIVVSSNDTLHFTHIGYASQEIPVDNRIVFNVIMVASESMMDEMAVVGYGTQRKITFTGAQSTLSIREMEKTSTPSLSNAIAGKMPGIITRPSSGEPGADAAQVSIRGWCTFGTTARLVLIDGVERNMNQINAQEIGSFTILKDASATAVYGVRGANGVIFINTKRGTVGKPTIMFRSEAASLTALRLPNYINGGE